MLKSHRWCFGLRIIVIMSTDVEFHKFIGRWEAFINSNQRLFPPAINDLKKTVILFHLIRPQKTSQAYALLYLSYAAHCLCVCVLVSRIILSALNWKRFWFIQVEGWMMKLLIGDRFCVCECVVLTISVLLIWAELVFFSSFCLIILQNIEFHWNPFITFSKLWGKFTLLEEVPGKRVNW